MDFSSKGLYSFERLFEVVLFVTESLNFKLESENKRSKTIMLKDEGGSNVGIHVNYNNSLQTLTVTTSIIDQICTI